MIDERNDKQIRFEVHLTKREWLYLKKVSAAEGIDANEYTNNIIRAWVAGQLYGEYQKLFNQMNIHEKANLFGDVKLDGTINFSSSSVKREKDKIRDKDKEK